MDVSQSHPTIHIPIVTLTETIAELISMRFKNIANVQLNKLMVDYLLTLNKDNRRVKTESVKAYVNSFLKTGYACINLMHISADGKLVDGQHRLLALQTLFDNGSQIEAWQYIKFGTTPDVIMDIDNGVSRNFKDMLRLQGYVTDTTISSSLRQYASLTSASFRVKFTANELRDIYDNDFKQVLEIGNFHCLRNLQLLGGHSYRPAPWVISVFRICQKAFGTEKMRLVYEQFYNDEDNNLPMVRFRIWLVNNRNQFHFTPHTKNAKLIMGYMFYAVKKCINGEKISRLVSSELGFTINGRRF